MTELPSDPVAEEPPAPPAPPAEPEVGEVRFGPEDTLEEWTGTAWVPFRPPARDTDEAIIYKLRT